MPLHIHPDIERLVPYSPGKPLDELERELGIHNAVKLASNENPLGPSPRALAVLHDVAKTLNRYPDGGAHHLIRALADRWKVGANQIVVGNGSDEIIGLLVKAFLSPGDEAIMADHTFIMYKLAVTAGHGVSIEIPLVNWRHDLASMVKAITPRTKLVFVCNPNNPTGTMVTKAEVAHLMAQVPDHVIVVFDEAYHEYVRDPEYPDTLQYVLSQRNAIVLRTFSKIYGLAGLRIGYGLTTPTIVNYLNRVRPPFNTNSLAQHAAVAAMADEEHLSRSRMLNASEMQAVENGLRNLGIEPIPSQANFLYFDTHQDGRQIFDQLLREGVIVRHIRGSMLRVTIGRPEENRRFLDALRTVLHHDPAKNPA